MGSKQGEFRRCLRCKKKFYAHRYLIKTGRGKYCSRDCANKSQIFGGRSPKEIWRIIKGKKYKNCRICHQWFPATIEYYFKHKETRDNLRSECRKCQCRMTGEYHNKIKKEVIRHYGGECINSTHIRRITDPLLLVLDHINNDGKEHRRIIKQEGTNIYLWTRRKKYPKGLQVLCWNCNMYKEFTGRLPNYNEGGN